MEKVKINLEIVLPDVPDEKNACAPEPNIR
jgi:hypothetical protein